MKISKVDGALMPIRGGFRLVPRRTGLYANVGTTWIAPDGLAVISSCDVLFLPGTHDTKVGPTWVVSVSGAAGGRERRRPTDAELLRVIKALDMPAFDEDNHQPGITRTLFCPIAEDYRSACECKLDETLIVDADGYQWTNSVDGPCRGCELAARHRTLRALYPTLALRPCPLHPD